MRVHRSFQKFTGLEGNQHISRSLCPDIPPRQSNMVTPNPSFVEEDLFGPRIWGSMIICRGVSERNNRFSALFACTEHPLVNQNLHQSLGARDTCKHCGRYGFVLNELPAKKHQGAFPCVSPSKALPRIRSRLDPKTLPNIELLVNIFVFPLCFLPFHLASPTP